MKNLIIGTLFLIFCTEKASGQLTAEELKIKISTTLILGKIDSAIYWGNQLTTRYRTVKNLLLFGSLYEIKQDTTRANLQYQQALTLSGNDRFVVYNTLARSYLKRESALKAIYFAKQSLEINPSQPEVHFFLANIFSVSNQREESFFHYRRAYVLDSTNKDYIQQMYLLEYSSGNKKEAIRLLEKIVNPIGIKNERINSKELMDSAELRRILALASGYLEVDRFEEANALLLSIKELHLFGDSTYVLLGESFKGLGLLDKAAGAYQAAIQLDTTPEQGQYEELARIYEQMGEPQMSVKTLLEGAQKNIPALKEWAEDYQKALEEITRVTKLLATASQEDKKHLLVLLAKLYNFSRHQDFAIQVLRDLETLAAQTDSTTFLLAIAHNQRGHFNVSIKLVNQLLIKEPKNSEYHLLLLTNLINERFYQNFLDALSRAQEVGVDTTRPEIQAMVVKAYSVIGETPMRKTLQYQFQ